MSPGKIFSFNRQSLDNISYRPLLNTVTIGLYSAKIGRMPWHWSCCEVGVKPEVELKPAWVFMNVYSVAI